MKSLIRPSLWVLVSALAFATPSFAQEAFRVGFVNTDRIFREANSAKSAQAKLEQEFSKREKELGDLQATIKGQADKFDREAPTLAETQRQQRQRQLLDQNREFERKRREFQEDLN